MLTFLVNITENKMQDIIQQIKLSLRMYNHSYRTHTSPYINLLSLLFSRSDIEIVETEDGWLAVRTSAVEEQSTACQLMVLLVEKLQVLQTV